MTVPKQDLLTRSSRVQQFWKRFNTDLQNEKKLRSSAEQHALTILQNRKLKVYRSTRQLW